MFSNEHFMQLCLDLAKRGAAYVSPNPMVGAVLVFENKVIGKGYHEQFGEAHAEVNCINSVSKENKGLIQMSTLFVSLEPCSHTGKTPPCADFIVQHEIKKVVVACRDYSSKVNGKGIEHLKNHGVEVLEGVLENEAIALNKRFFTFHKLKRPYIILKWAESSEGFIGNEEKQIKLTNSSTDKLVHQWRSLEDAIWVGFNTVKIDNPQLNVRHVKGKNPIRIVIDRKLELQGHLHILNNEQATILFNQVMNAKEGLIKWVKLNTNDEIHEVLNYLYKHEIMSVFVEGGAKLITKLLEANCWDEARIIKTNTTLQAGTKSPHFPKKFFIEEYSVEHDQITIFKNKSI